MSIPTGRLYEERRPPAEGCLYDLLFTLPPTVNVYRYDTYGRVSIAKTSNVYSGESDYPDLRNVTLVKTVDLKVQNNVINHHTEKFDISISTIPNPRLVVRRGQAFTIDLNLSRPYEEGTANLLLAFGIGNTPICKQKTYVEITPSQYTKPDEWNTKVVSTSNNTVTIDVTPPCTCPIGKWYFVIDTILNNNRFRYECKDPITILFNPWCKDDVVYVEDTRLLDEYILNETGRIYVGTWEMISDRPWNYGQFQSNVLDTALYLLDHAGMEYRDRGNAVLVIRKVSAVVNSSDENGVLHGNWTENFADGTSPLKWTGSVAIMEEFWKTKHPVKYGQCWVFAGIANTVARALGIPSRVVTNFESAIDGDGSFTLERYINNEGIDLKERQDDSIWNFHVWNEAWMSRSDLPAGYGGWQVYDATPKITSDGVMCCGPTSVVAIQQGDVNLKYDGEAGFVDVNGDIFYWWPDPRGAWLCVRVDENRIGRYISTKAAFTDQREDLTHTYKNIEGTSEERATVSKAMKMASKTPSITKYYDSKAEDVQFTVEQNSAKNIIGGNFDIRLKMKNNSSDRRTLDGQIVVKSVYYTGISAGILKKHSITNIILQPGEEKLQTIAVTPDEYGGKLKAFYNLNSSFWVKVQETGQVFVTMVQGRFLKPKLLIKAPAEIQANREFDIEVSFTNPLNQVLTHSVITLDGLSQTKKYPQRNVQPGGNFKANLTFTATKPGNTELIIAFNSQQLEDITGTHKIVVHQQ